MSLATSTSIALFRTSSESIVVIDILIDGTLLISWHAAIVGERFWSLLRHNACVGMLTEVAGCLAKLGVGTHAHLRSIVIK